MDEAKGRQLSKKHGIQLIGTLGLLVIAKKRGLISQVKPLLDQLVNTGFHMSVELYQTVLS